MQKTVMKNSKKGFSLPLAIAVSLFLIIISTSLLFISIQSMSTTTVDISGRQAYLNVKSALDYARSYYSTHVSDYSKVGTEYLIMNDPGGTTEKGAKIEKSVDQVYNANTYVMAVYKKGEGSNKSTLTLTAFSRYSDAYGNKAKLARLTVTYTVGGSGPNRLTIIGGTPKSESTGGVDSITLNVKKPKSMDSMMLTYYIWTYEDPQNAYQGFYNSDNTISSFDWDEKVIKKNGWVGRLNAATVSDKKVEPNDPWGKGNGVAQQNGPQGVFADTGNGWFMGEFFPKKSYVPWINVMFAQQGSVLAGDDGPNNIYDSQVNEMLHLWYLDPSDKNIYFEFMGDQKTETGNDYANYFEKQGTKYYTKYYEKATWDGKKGLEDTVVVYVKNPKTTVHLRIKDLDDYNNETSLASETLYPIIAKVKNKDGTAISGQSYIGDGTRKSENIPMAYEGCGWWVANVETSRTFDIEFVYSGSSHKAYAIDANSVSNEFWFVENDGLNPHMTEDSALGDLGINPNSYVTIKAKSSEYGSRPTPKLIYSNVGIESTTEKIDLLDELLKATQLVKARYTADSYAKVKQAMDEGFALIDDQDFISTRPGPSDEEKVIQADTEYRAKKQALFDAEKGLKNVETTISDLRTLISYVNQGKYAESKQASDGEYDAAVFASFVGDASHPTNYSKAKAAVANPKSVTLDEVAALETGLNNDLTTLRAARLDRDTLNIKIQELAPFENLVGVYEEEYQNAFNTAIAEARTAAGTKETSQGNLDLAYNNLVAAKTALDENAISILDFDRLNQLKTKANFYLGAATKENCTDATYDALSAAYDKAVNEAPLKTKQTEVNAIADELDAAIDSFYIQKPAGSIDQLKSLNSIRLWVVNQCADPEVTYIVDKYAPGSETPTRVDSITMNSWGPVTGVSWRYDDIALTDCDRVIVNTVKAGEVLKSTPEIMLSTVEDFNLCVVIDETGNMTITKIVTVYGDFDGDEVKGKIGSITNASSYDSPYYCFRYVVTEANKNDQFNVVNKHNSLNPDEPDPFEVYNAGRIEEPGDYVMSHSIDDSGKTSASLINVFDIYPKYSAAPETPTDPVEPTEPDAGPILADEDVEVGDVIHTFADYIFFTDNPEHGTWATGGNKIRCYFWGSGTYAEWPGEEMQYYKNNSSGQAMYKIVVPDGADHCIFNCGGIQTFNIELSRGTGYYKDGLAWDAKNSKNKMKVGTWPEADTVWHGLESYKEYGPFESQVIYIKNKNTDWKNLQIKFWGGSNAKQVPMPGFYLEYSHMDGSDAVYKITPPLGSTGFVVSNGNDTQKSVNGNVVLGHHYTVETTNSGSLKNLVDTDATVVSPDDPSGGGGTYDAPGYKETDLAGANGTMRYVGGNKVRIINASYSELFGEGGKKNEYGNAINSSNLFGGAGINNESGGRLGYSKLVPYYDWFERKIPVSIQASYDFTIEGLSSKAGKTNIQTKIAKKARGNVWLEMLSTDNAGGGHFQNYNIYTFDPEEKQIGDTLNVYFRLPYVDTTEHPDWVTWHDPELTLDGPFVDTLTGYDPKLTETLTRTGNTNIYVKKGIKKNNPFLTFTVYGPDRDDPTVGKTYEYKTCFQGGDFVLFDPSLNDNYGGWEEFVSDQEQLKRAVNLLRSSYYGCKIVSQYDSTGSQITDAFFTYSSGLLNLYSNYAETKTTNGCTFYVTKNYDDKNDTWCYNEARAINAYLKSARNLYAVMNDCKQYISKPLTSANNSFHGGEGGAYPEYVSRTVKQRKYTAASITSLRNKLSAAEKVYAANSTAYEMDQAANAIKGAVGGLEVDSEGSIAMVFYDCQGKVEKGSKFQIRFTLTSNSTDFKYRDVDEYNPERFPIYFLSPDGSNNYDEIYNVSFIEIDKENHEIEHRAQPVMKMDEAWVYLDQSGNPKWSKNSVTDYREINTDIFQMTDPNDTQEYIMKKTYNAEKKKWEYSSMTLLFTKDADVEACVGADFATYKIKAGSYFFDDSNAGLFETEGVVDLYTTEARSFFTNENNIGYYVVGENDLNENRVDTVSGASEWRVDNDFKTGATTINGYVNFSANEGSFTRFTPYYGFESDSGIFFRWETTSPLYLSSTVKMVGSEFKFANMGVLDGTKTRTPHFYLICSDSSESSMIVEFRTDFYVKYVDKKGNKHQFAIREGKYEIRKPKSDPTRIYIADLFDETYWKGMEDITYFGRGTLNEGGTGSTGELTQGTYSS